MFDRAVEGVFLFFPDATFRRAAEARADVNERKTSLEIVPISKISNSRGADQKYKLNCNGKAIMYRVKNKYSCDAARPAVIGILEKDKITETTIPTAMPRNAC
ncbi:hypothetical protein J6590_070065 [Homalodisca vitripennis]|nr:hypothetical protein J6590_070065 [Homalodisca vitripennis]